MKPVKNLFGSFLNIWALSGHGLKLSDLTLGGRLAVRYMTSEGRARLYKEGGDTYAILCK